MLLIIGITKDFLDILTLGFLGPILGGIYWFIVAIWALFQGPKFLAKIASLGIFLVPAYGLFSLLGFIPGLGNILSILTPDTTISSFLISRLRTVAGAAATTKKAGGVARKLLPRLAGFSSSFSPQPRESGMLKSALSLKSGAVPKPLALQEGGRGALEQMAHQPQSTYVPTQRAPYRPPKEIAQDIRKYAPQQTSTSLDTTVATAPSHKIEPLTPRSHIPTEPSRMEQVWEEIKNPERLALVGNTMATVIPPIGPGSFAKSGSAAWSAGVRFGRPVEEVAQKWGSSKSLVGNAGRIREHFKQGAEIVTSIGKDGKVRIIDGNTRVYGAQKLGIGAEEIRAAYTTADGTIVHGTLADALNAGKTMMK